MQDWIWQLLDDLKGLNRGSESAGHPAQARARGALPMITTNPEAAQAWLEGRREEVRGWCHGDSTRVAGVALELDSDSKTLFSSEGPQHEGTERGRFLRYIEGGKEDG